MTFVGTYRFHSVKIVYLMKILVVALMLLVLASCDGTTSADVSDITTEEAEGYPDWQQSFDLEVRELSDRGESTYFILEPGFQLVLESETETLYITVLDETKEFNAVTTRVVEEREEKNGNLYEVSRNFFAIDNETGDVFYFGEEVDFYENDRIVRHTGAWLAYENGNQPGLIMPGIPEIGMKYFQEIAPGAAMDRAEIVSLTEKYSTPAGDFVDCLVTRETTPLEPFVAERKTYAPGIGLIQDERLRLVSYGYVDQSD